ncbi:hypothetical protein FACS1894109_19970 [Spirochaetia bacterium]|nr:hypothetical protein FACS1894109_19970 [Spirochaetia bacterium]
MLVNDRFRKSRKWGNLYVCHIPPEGGRINADVIQTLKNTFHQSEIVILPKDEYDEWEKERHNAAFTKKLQQRMKRLDEGKGIAKTMAELRSLS